MTSVYWYAPFDNAAEIALAEAMGKSSTFELTVESISTRFGRPLTIPAETGYRLVRDLPPPASEQQGRTTAARRAWTAVERSRRRSRLVRRGNFSLLHLHTFNPVTDWAAIPRLRRKTPIVVQSVHNVRPHESVFPRRLETMLLRKGYRACSALVVAHDDLREQLVREFAIDPKRIVTIPLPATMPVRSASSVRNEDRESMTFLFFGTLRRNKGVTVLLDAIRQLNHDPEHGERLKFIIAGRGDPELEDDVKAAERELGNLIAEIGYVTEQRRQELYDQAHCVLLPYTSISAQSGVLMNAYSQRLPVIATDVGPIGATMRQYNTGWVIKPNSQSSLVDAILAAQRSPSDLAEAGVRAGAVADDRTPERIAESFHDLYDRLISAAEM